MRSFPSRRLLLLRHAKAVEPGGVPDLDRKLSARGRRDAAAVGQHLATTGQCDLVLCSPAVRTRETWDGAAEAGAAADKLEYRDEIYEASWIELARLVETASDHVGTLLMVGHGPGLPGLAYHLATASDLSTSPEASDGEALARLRQGFPTSGLAELSLDGPWSQLRAGSTRLVSFVVPRG